MKVPDPALDGGDIGGGEVVAPQEPSGAYDEWADEAASARMLVFMLLGGVILWAIIIAIVILK